MRLFRPRRGALAWLLPLAPCLILAACGASTLQPGAIATSTPSPTATPAPQASVAVVANSQHFPDSKSGGTTGPCANGDPLINGDCGVSVTATCPNGEPVLSGGYTLDDPLAFVSSSYPSGASAWTITAHDEGQDGGSHPVTVTASAVCLQANFAAGLQVATSTPNVLAGGIQAASLNCPQGTVVTGGGFRGSAGGGSTFPSGNGWQATLGRQVNSAATPMLFAVCAGNHLVAASVQSSAKTFNPGDANGQVSSGCPQGQLLVGGGGKGDGPGATLANAASKDAAQWSLTVNGPNPFAVGPGVTFTATVYAVCVTLA